MSASSSSQQPPKQSLSISVEYLDSLLIDCVAAAKTPRSIETSQTVQSRKRSRRYESNLDEAAISSFLSVGAWNDLASPDHETISCASKVLGVSSDFAAGDVCSWEAVTNVVLDDAAKTPSSIQPQLKASKRIGRFAEKKAIAKFLSVGAWNELTAPTHEQIEDAASYLGIGSQVTSEGETSSSATQTWSPVIEMISENMSHEHRIVLDPPPAKALALKKIGSGTKLYDAENFGEISMDCITCVVTRVSKKGEV